MKMTVVSWYMNPTDPVTDFIQTYPGCVLPFKINGNRNDTFKIISEQFVFFAQNPEEYVDFVSMLNQNQIEPVKVILVIGTEDSQEIDFSRISSISLENDIIDLLVVHDINRTDHATVTTFFPYSNNSCENINPVTLDQNPLNFPNKFKNFKGCPVRVSLVNHKPFTFLVEENGKKRIGGVEGNLLHLIAEILNFTVTPHTPCHGAFGAVHEGKWTGAVGDLVYGRADLSMTSAVLNLDRYSALLTSSAYKTLDIIWIAPNRVRLLTWTTLILPLTTNLSLPLFVTFVIYISIAYLISKIKHTGRVNSNNHYILHAWATFMNQNVIFKETDSLMRYVFAIWLLFCIILRIIFEGDLVSALQKKTLAPPLKSFEEALTYMDGYSGIDSVLPYYENTSVPERYKIINLDQVEDLIHRISKGEKHLLVIDSWSVKQYGIKVQIIEEPVVRAPVSIYFRRRWSAAGNIDVVLRRIIETGLFKHFVVDFLYSYSMKVDAENNDDLDLTYYQITMADMIACFISLIVEWIICILVLFVEIIYHKIQTRKAKQAKLKKKRILLN